MNKEERKAIEYYQDKEISFGVNFDTEKLLRTLGITEEDSFENHQIRFKTLLNLIEKLQKENKELKQERNNNYRMIALAQNEVLGYMQGYEDGKKLKRSAVACIVENQQYHIIQKRFEHYEKHIEKLQKENEELKIKNNAIKRESEAYAENMIRLDNELNLEKEKSKYEWIRQNCLPQELVNKLYIPKQIVKDKIEEEKLPLTIVGGRKNKKTLEYGIKLGRRQALQELLEGRK